MASSSRAKKRKAKCSTSFSQPRSAPEEAIAEQAATLTRTDLKCPICSDLFREVYSTQCGHSFCFQCISAALQRSQHCPVCKAAVQGRSALHPNCSLNDVVAKFRSQTAKNRETAKCSHPVADILTLAADLSSQELCRVLQSIAEHSQHNATREKQVRTAVALSFLARAIHLKEKELQRVKQQLDVLTSDCDRLVISQGVRSVLSCTTPPSHLASSHVDAPTTGSPTAAWAGLVTQRNLRVEANFDELLEDYFKTKLPDVGEQPEGAESLEHFCDGLQKFTQFNSFRELATLTYGEQTNNCCSVSSVEFDHDGEFFAVAGVTKKIKVFEYQSVVRNAGFTQHFPVHEMSCAAKLSCVAYNPYHKQQLVSSDYEGRVCVWDTSIGRRTALHHEHDQRVWSVAYNPQEPTLFASGSDDCTVKLWSMGKATSILSLSARANICSVKFNPHSRYMLAYGSLDHGVHYVDLRKPTQPVMEFLGHKKAVSYVNFMSSSELVSASTDSELKSWHTERGVCLRTYRGHLNDKNFVGLSVTPDFIACGSENNAVFVYSKQVSSPLLTYQYNPARGFLPGSSAGDPSQSPEPPAFVSAVSWRNSSNVLLAANSQGQVKVLALGF